MAHDLSRAEFALVVAVAVKVERKACAAICDEASRAGDVDPFEADTAADAARMIRARGEAK